MKIRAKCVGCKRERWFVDKRELTLPNGLVITSKDLICKACYKMVLEKLNQHD